MPTPAGVQVSTAELTEDSLHSDKLVKQGQQCVCLPFCVAAADPIHRYRSSGLKVSLTCITHETS